jgi:hypothetical protein
LKSIAFHSKQKFQIGVGSLPPSSKPSKISTLIESLDLPLLRKRFPLEITLINYVYKYFKYGPMFGTKVGHQGQLLY